MSRENAKCVRSKEKAQCGCSHKIKDQMAGGHGQCLLWYNYCSSRSISNMGFPSHVEVRQLARPGAMLHYVAQRALVIFRFHQHFLILHIGMFDLLPPTVHPLELAERFRNAISLIAAYFNHCSPCIIFIGQPSTPWHLETDHMYLQRSDAFHSRSKKKPYLTERIRK